MLNNYPQHYQDLMQNPSYKRKIFDKITNSTNYPHKITENLALT
jgi:hypothetical protein